jgi:hypothetical protein
MTEAKQEKKIEKAEKKIEELKEEKKELAQKLKEKAKESAHRLQKETKKAISTAIIAGFSFLLALAWRDVITEAVEKITSISPLQGKLINAIMITIISASAIAIITVLTSEK